MNKRKAETLIEIVIAMGLFGVIMSGLFDFMANQTLALTRMKEREELMVYAQKYISNGDFSSRTEGDIEYNLTNNTLTVTKMKKSSIKLVIQ